MFLMRGMSHILGYVGSRIKDPIDDLIHNYSLSTCVITLIVLAVADDFSFVCLLVYGVQHSLKAAMLTVAAINVAMCIIFSILTVIMKNVNSCVAYYTRAIVNSFLIMALILAILACPLPTIIS